MCLCVDRESLPEKARKGGKEAGANEPQDLEGGAVGKSVFAV